MRWPRSRLSFAPVRVHVRSTIGRAILLFMRGVPPRAPRLRALTSTRTGAKSGAIFAALGEKCGLDILDFGNGAASGVATVGAERRCHKGFPAGLALAFVNVDAVLAAAFENVGQSAVVANHLAKLRIADIEQFEHFGNRPVRRAQQQAGGFHRGCR